MYRRIDWRSRDEHGRVRVQVWDARGSDFTAKSANLGIGEAIGSLGVILYEICKTGSPAHAIESKGACDRMIRVKGNGCMGAPHKFSGLSLGIMHM